MLKKDTFVKVRSLLELFTSHMEEFMAVHGMEENRYCLAIKLSYIIYFLRQRVMIILFVFLFISARLLSL